MSAWHSSMIQAAKSRGMSLREFADYRARIAEDRRRAGKTRLADSLDETVRILRRMASQEEGM